MKKSNQIEVQDVSRQDYALDLSSYTHSLFISPEWMCTVAPIDNILFLHFYLDGKVVAKLSGMVQNGSKLVGRYLFFYAGPGLIVQEQSMYDACMSALLKYARRKHFSKIDMLNYDQQHGWICSEKGYYKRGIEEFAMFFDSPDIPIKFSKSLMYNVRKAQKVNSTFHEETSERVLKRLHELLEETQRLRFHKYGTQYSAYPYRFQTKESTDELFKSGLMHLYHIEVDGEIHCVRCALEKDKRMFGLMIASDSFTYKYGLQHYMQYCLINKLHQEGFRYYNIAGTAPGVEGKGLADYKESLGCKRFYVYGAYTHFISFPQIMLNPFMNAGRFLARKFNLEKIAVAVSKIISGTNKG